MAYGSNIPQWGQVNADFSDSSRMFDFFQKGLSNAGTIFGQLRASILEEEQRAVENAFREKNLSEQIRQFGITSDLNRDKLNEDIRYHDIQDANADDDRSQRATQAEMQHRAAMANVGVAQGRLAFDRERHMSAEAKENAIADYTKYANWALSASPVEIKNEYERLENALYSPDADPNSPEYRDSKLRKNLIDQRSSILGPNDQRNAINNFVAAGTGNAPTYNPWDVVAEEQYNRNTKELEELLNSMKTSDKERSELAKTLNSLQDAHDVGNEVAIEAARMGASAKSINDLLTSMGKDDEGGFFTDSRVRNRLENLRDNPNQLRDALGLPPDSNTNTPDYREAAINSSSTIANMSPKELATELKNYDITQAQIDSAAVSFMRSNEGVSSSDARLAAMEDLLNRAVAKEQRRINAANRAASDKEKADAIRATYNEIKDK